MGGTVHDHVITHSRDSDGRRNKSIWPVIDFEYAGDNYRFQAQVAAGDKHPVGSTVPVLVADRDPYTARLKSDDRYTVSAGLIFMGLIFSTIGITQTDFGDFTFITGFAEMDMVKKVITLAIIGGILYIPYQMYRFKRRLLRLLGTQLFHGRLDGAFFNFGN